MYRGGEEDEGLTPLYTRYNESNTEYVGRLWLEFKAGGVDGLAGLLPDDVRREFFAPLTGQHLELRAFQLQGDDVLVHAERLGEGGRTEPLWFAFHFDGRRLTGAERITRSPALASSASRTQPG